MIVQNVSTGENPLTDVSFTLAESQGDLAMNLLRAAEEKLSASGVAHEIVRMDSGHEAAEDLLDVAARSYLLADHEKFPGSGFLEVARLPRFTALLTDRPLPIEIDLPEGEAVEVLLP